MAGWNSRLFVPILLAAAALGSAACAGRAEQTSVAAPATPAVVQPTAVKAPIGTAPAAPTTSEALATAPATSPTRAAEPDVASPATAPTLTSVPPPVAPGEVLAAYLVRSSFAVTSTLPDGSYRLRQVGTEGFAVQTDGPLGSDAVYTVTYTTDADQETLVYVLRGDHAALQTGGRWLTAERRAEQRLGDPNGLVDLPFLAGIGQGTPLGEETVNGVAARRYRIDDLEQFRSLVGDALADGDGEPVRVTLDGWLAPEGYVARYVLNVDVANAAFLDDAGAETPAQQQVRIVYDVMPMPGRPTVTWPEEAPAPSVVVVPGFAPDEFPLPAGAEVRVSLEMVEILTLFNVTETLGFYRDTLGKSGWSIEGAYSVYTATNGENSVILLLQPAEGGGTRIQVLTVGQ